MKIDPTNPAEIKLMQEIRAKWAATIHTACVTSTVPEAFLAGLVANESGGNESAKRFEPHVLLDLWEVVQGRRPAYSSILLGGILDFVVPELRSVGFAVSPARILETFARLDSLATSWGLTQIMGYEAIPFALQVSDLALPATSLRVTLRMLSQFAAANDLDVTKNFSELLDCWNTGRPHRPTADPDYIPNALARMQVYLALLEEPPRSVSA